MADANPSTGEGATAAATEAHADSPVTEAQTPTEETSEQGEIKEDDQSEEEDSQTEPEDARKGQEDAQAELFRQYRWCKCECDPAQYAGVDHYFLHMDSQQSVWEEPTEPYWLWNAATQTIDPVGLQHSHILIPSAPKSSAPAPKVETTDPADPQYTGYNPKIHGNYDPNAPYAQYHNQKRREEWFTEQGYDPATAEAAAAAAAATAAPTADNGAEYGSVGTFNRFTGGFQRPEQSADRHSASNKAGRQMSAFFDPDEAMNQHDGRSLKDERRKQKLSKKQIQEHNEKRKARKQKKMMDFLRS